MVAYMWYDDDVMCLSQFDVVLLHDTYTLVYCCGLCKCVRVVYANAFIRDTLAMCIGKI